MHFTFQVLSFVRNFQCSCNRLFPAAFVSLLSDAYLLCCIESGVVLFQSSTGSQCMIMICFTLYFFYASSRLLFVDCVSTNSKSNTRIKGKQLQSRKIDHFFVLNGSITNFYIEYFDIICVDHWTQNSFKVLLKRLMI